ncbi:MFS transporter [Paenibacillus lentus]|uniref:MFS transporter n=1 Tax=Paenibacillus lentus TaxID=1338368 RepID=UPI00364C37BD
MNWKRNAWLLIGGQSISIAGDSLMMMVLPLMVLDLTGSVFQVSIVFILTQLPTFFGFLSGTFRRFYRPKILIVSYDFIRFIILLITSVFMIFQVSIYAVYVMVFLFNIFSTLFRPTRIEFITHIVPEDSLQRFNSVDRTFEAVAYAIGFGLGGYAYFYLSMPQIFALNSLPFLLSGISLLFMRSKELAESGAGSQPSDKVKSSFWRTALSVNKRPMLSFLVYGETLAGLAFGVFMSLFVVYGRQFLGVDSIMLGHLEMVQALAATIAGLLLSFGLLKISERALGFFGYFGMGLSMLLLGVNSMIWMTFLLMTFIGAFNMLYSIGVRTLLQKNSSNKEMIHIFALESILSRSSLIVGSGLAGFILSTTNLTVNWVIFASGILLILVSIWAIRALFTRGFESKGKDVGV